MGCSRRAEHRRDFGAGPTASGMVVVACIGKRSVDSMLAARVGVGSVLGGVADAEVSRGTTGSGDAPRDARGRPGRLA